MPGSPGLVDPLATAIALWANAGIHQAANARPASRGTNDNRLRREASEKAPQVAKPVAQEKTAHDNVTPNGMQSAKVRRSPERLAKPPSSLGELSRCCR
jgi:hypothetical protein